MLFFLLLFPKMGNLVIIAIRCPCERFDESSERGCFHAETSHRARFPEF
jgi:hypothetical protein